MSSAEVKTLPQLAEQSLERLGERRTIVFEGQDYTNLQIHHAAQSLQTALTERGLKKGKICAMMMMNDPAVFMCFQGVFRTGGTVVPVMAQNSPEELRFVLQDTESIGVITDSMLLFKVREAVKGLDHIKWVIVHNGKENLEATPPEIPMQTLLQAERDETIPEMDPSDDVALMLYTSGTTGKPKGVMLTHDNLLAAARAGLEAAEYETQEHPRIGLNVLPLAHMFGIGVMNAGMLLPEHLKDSYSVQMRMFEPVSYMKLIQDYKVNTTAAVPTILSLVMNHPKEPEFDLTSLEEIIVGAAPLPRELAQSFMKRYDCFLREGYGMTENAAMATINRRSWGYKPGSAGKAYSTNEVAIMDHDGNLLKPGETGEIVTRGPMTMKGYYKRPEATAEALKGGWLHTGDLGYLDEDGWLFVVDRKKDMIIRGGENIYPAELEDIIYRHPAVNEAAVIGLPDDVYGERVIAYVVRKKDQEVTGEAIIEFVCQHTHKFKAPEEVHFIDMLPKSGVGKILRRQLRDEAKAATEAKSGG